MQCLNTKRFESTMFLHSVETRWELWGRPVSGVPFTTLSPLQRQHWADLQQTQDEWCFSFSRGFNRNTSFAGVWPFKCLAVDVWGSLRDGKFMSRVACTRNGVRGLSRALCPWVSHTNSLGLNGFICKRSFGLSYLPVFSSRTTLWFKHSVFALTPLFSSSLFNSLL